MSPALLLALQGITLMLSRVQALTCQSEKSHTVKNISEMLLRWTVTKEQVCEDGWGCQDTLMLIENGPQFNLVVSKSCTPQADQEARITRHRAGPGLSVVSYTRVCRQSDLCNNISNTLPLWDSPPKTVPGSLRCPVCLSTEGCLSAPELTCPAGTMHCYNGVVLITGGGISLKLRVQGCTSQAGCNLLNDTQNIGSLTVSETCDPKALLTCHKGITLTMLQNLTQTPSKWTAGGYQTCDAGEVCQETLLFIDVGPKSLIVGSKGCSESRTQESVAVTIHSGSPGTVIASYARFCSSSGCNRANSSSVLLDVLPHPDAPVPGDLKCPVSVQLGSFAQKSEVVTCPKGTTRCYRGSINLRGGWLSASVNLQGCVAQPSGNLLKHTHNIGVFSVMEYEDEKKPHLQDRAAPTSYMALVVRLGLSLALWCALPADSISP